MKFRLILAALFSVLLMAVNPAAAETAALKIALVHFKVAYKEPAKNLEALKALHREAAAQGAKLILNTELALSGYSFSCRADVRPFTRTLEDRDIREMGDLARELAVYIGITFPERNPDTDSFYNAAAVFSPDGKMILGYHKIYGEKRWARAGDPAQENVFHTPWGRIGVAICADSYFGLIPRALALKGADLIWVPANWPPTGLVSPLDVWQTRAMENGVYLAACNRTGKDRVMDCTQSVSAVIGPDGAPLFSRSAQDSALFYADIPLDRTGKIKNGRRQRVLAGRKVGHYRQIYLDPWTENLTRYYKLPEPGRLQVRCITAPSTGLDIDHIREQVTGHPSKETALWLLPRAAEGSLDLEKLKDLAASRRCGFALSMDGEDGRSAPVLVTGKGVESFMTDKGEFPFRQLYFGPAALAMVPMADLRHPELAMVLSKLGCDLVLLSENDLSQGDERLAKLRTIDGLAVAAAGGGRAMTAHMKGIHGRLNLERAKAGEVCTLDLDTSDTRKKDFYDRVDYDLLLGQPKGGN